ncbi:MAG TPA: NAD(P)/FAD-dependent oxidoreductase, partial [Polyangiales bacterium]|nr:NAD(P)/FAD-dependent oxidoreductase [Polyangiales bacterium]
MSARDRPDQPVRVELSLHPDALLDPARLRAAAAKAAQLNEARVQDVRIVRRAIDARRRNVRVQLLVDVFTAVPAALDAPQPLALSALSGAPAVLIVGAGPAGLFCAWRLAQLGVRAHVLDRGQGVAQRRRDVALLSQRGQLDEESNYCFGEGGAGTFSDGKLYTRANKRGPVRDVLEALCAYGASDEILRDARPHIGTNRLPRVVGALRAHLESAGQLVTFGARVIGLLQRGGRVAGVQLADGSTLDARAVVLATGHSAADVYRMLHAAGAQLEPKPFAIGVRVEHAQAFIDRTQYGELAGHPALGAAAYRLVERAGDVGVFSFCMCPGGYIVPAATSQGQQVVNGWSPSARRGRFANSGLVVEVGPAQLAAAGLEPGDPFSGLGLQQQLEARAYEAGGGEFVAPAQRLSDLLAGRASSALPETSYPRGVAPARLDQLLGVLGPPLRDALARIERKLRGFAGADAVAVGLESRTSAPLRVARDSQSLQAA